MRAANDRAAVRLGDGHRIGGRSTHRLPAVLKHLRTLECRAGSNRKIRRVRAAGFRPVPSATRSAGWRNIARCGKSWSRPAGRVWTVTRETKHESEVQCIAHRAIFDVPCEVVFRAWTDGEQLQQWYHFNDEWQIAEVESDLRVGGVSRRLTRRTAACGTSWAIPRVRPPERLVHTCRFDFPDFDEDETLVPSNSTIKAAARGSCWFKRAIATPSIATIISRAGPDSSTSWPGACKALRSIIVAIFQAEPSPRGHGIGGLRDKLPACRDAAYSA